MSKKNKTTHTAREKTPTKEKSPSKTNKSNSKIKKNNIKDEEEESSWLDAKSSSYDDEFSEEIKGKGKGKNKTTSTKQKGKGRGKKDLLDEEELEIINQQFKELEANEKKNNITSTKTKTKNTRSKSKTAGNAKIIDDDEDLVDLDIQATEKKKQITGNKKTIPDTTGKKAKKPKQEASLPENTVAGVLNGLTFVMTGVFSIDRDKMTDLIKSLGGRTTGSVTGKTNYLLTGSILEDGRNVWESSKYKKAKEKGVKLMNELEFEEFVRKNLGDESFTVKEGYGNTSSASVSLGKVNKNPNQMDIDDPNSEILNKLNEANKMRVLWTDKHHPQDITEIVGNQNMINQFITWLDDWEDVVLNGNKKEIEASYRGKGRMENPNARACLISGNPGIGKTTAVRLIAKLKGYRTYELNASDQRNKAIISKQLGFLFDNTTLFAGEIQGKNLIIMDEVDGMAGNEDRGGMAALIDIIKKTKTPIVCIANDRSHPKLRSLTNYCYDLKFSKPDKRYVVARLSEICARENFKVEPNALEYLVESAGNDIRQCVNFLEFWSRKFKDLTYMDMTEKHKKFNKDNLLMVSNFDASAKLLNKAVFRKLNFREKLNLFFIDYDLIPLLIHENYLTCYGNNKSKDDLKSLVKTSEHISVGDILEKKIRTQQEWTLLQNKGIHSCLAVGQFSGNFIPFPKFPELMGKFQKARKIKREIKELKYSFPNCSNTSIKEEIAPLILSKISNNLIDFGNDGIENCLEFMRDYKISIEKLKENVTDLQSNDKILTKFEKISPQIRAALTRKYNEAFKTSIVRKKKKESGGENGIRYDEEGNIVEIINEEDEEEGSVSKSDDENITIKTKATKARKGKSTKKK
jgi:replication factor C subunit 1